MQTKHIENEPRNRMNKNDANIQMTNYVHTEIGCARKRKNYQKKKNRINTHQRDVYIHSARGSERMRDEIIAS